MKKFGILLTIVFGITSMSFAQETVQELNDSINEAKVANGPRDRFMFNLSFDNAFHKETNGFKTQWHSRGIGLYYMYDIPIKNSRVSIAPGLGFRHVSLYHNSFMIEDANGTSFTAIADYKDNDDYKKHKLATNYIEIPVELRFFSKPGKSGKVVKAAVGFRGSFKLTAVNKETNKENDYYKKFKTKGYKDVNTFQAGPTLRVGYGGFNVFAYYGVLDVFKKDRGPSLTPFSIGISITSL